MIYAAALTTNGACNTVFDEDLLCCASQLHDSAVQLLCNTVANALQYVAL
jgi:hypothetical protein